MRMEHCWARAVRRSKVQEIMVNHSSHFDARSSFKHLWTNGQRACFVTERFTDQGFSSPKRIDFFGFLFRILESFWLIVVCFFLHVLLALIGPLCFEQTKSPTENPNLVLY